MAIDDWAWDKFTTVMANRLVITMKNLGHVISFVCAKQQVEPMRSLVTCPQGNFGVKKIEEVNHIYEETREKVDELFQSLLAEALSLSNKFGIEEKWSQSCGQ